MYTHDANHPVAQIMPYYLHRTLNKVQLKPKIIIKSIYIIHSIITPQIHLGQDSRDHIVFISSDTPYSHTEQEQPYSII